METSIPILYISIDSNFSLVIEIIFIINEGAKNCGISEPDLLCKQYNT